MTLSLLDKLAVLSNCTFSSGFYASPQQVQEEGNDQVHDDRLHRRWCRRMTDLAVYPVLGVFVILFHASPSVVNFGGKFELRRSKGKTITFGPTQGFLVKMALLEQI